MILIEIIFTFDKYLLFKQMLMKKTQNFVLIISLLMISCLFGCNKNEEMEMWIAAKKEPAFQPVFCDYVPTKMYKLKKTDNWSFLSEDIEGFDYEEGYEYYLLVSSHTIKNPPMDGSSAYYRLIRVISKEKSLD